MRIIKVLLVLASLVLMVGCSKEADKTLEAAPPPKSDARPETQGGQPKAAPVNTPTMQGPMTKPPGM